jgi:hypothetical protein
MRSSQQWQFLTEALRDRDATNTSTRFDSLLITYTYDRGAADEMRTIVRKHRLNLNRTLVVGSENPWIEYELFKAGAVHVRDLMRESVS